MALTSEASKPIKIKSTILSNVYKKLFDFKKQRRLDTGYQNQKISA